MAELALYHLLEVGELFLSLHFDLPSNLADLHHDRVCDGFLFSQFPLQVLSLCAGSESGFCDLLTEGTVDGLAGMGKLIFGGKGLYKLIDIVLDLQIEFLLGSIQVVYLELNARYLVAVNIVVELD